MTQLVQIAAQRRERLPQWARKSRTHFESLHLLKGGFRRLNLHTVCESARCPNIHECFHRGAATFMILGGLCTRGCGFCAVPKGNPRRQEMPIDPAEPANVARMAAEMKLRHVVITSVNRDDLVDGGSRHFAETVRQVRRALPDARVEVLTPDFCGDLEAVARVLDAGPHIFNHNVETVPRLYRRVRPQADYGQSLAVLSFAREHPWQKSSNTAYAGEGGAGFRLRANSQDPEGTPVCATTEPQGLIRPGGAGIQPAGLRPRAAGALIKSGFMVGLGETEAEVHALLRDLLAVGTDVATIGQYLQPTRRNLPVTAYIEPRQFAAYRDYGLSLGFKMVFSGPLVRSSYMADRVSEQTLC